MQNNTPGYFDVAGFDGQYEINPNTGDVRSKKSNKSLSVFERGIRKYVQMRRPDGTLTNRSIDSLIEETFDTEVERVKKKGMVGEENHKHKLNEQEVREIKFLVSSGKKTQAEMVDKYKVSRSLVSRIVKGEIWSHLK